MTCTLCKRDKPGDRYKKCSDCRATLAARMRTWIAAHPKARAASNVRAKAWIKEHPERTRVFVKKSTDKRKATDPAWWKAKKYREAFTRYGITAEQYESMLSSQGGCCAICKSDDPGGGKSRMAVDHDHVTGVVRQLLCQRCNIAVGMYEGKFGLRYIAYLMRHGSKVGRAARPQVVAQCA